MIFFNNKLKNPVLIKKVFSDKDFYDLKKHIEENNDKLVFDENFKRYVYNSQYLVDNFNKKLEPLAKKIFKNKNIETSYCLYARYQGTLSSLEKHKDLNANTYLIDVCINEKTPWPIFVENKEYVLQENQGLAFLPMEWEHWRNDFPDPENNIVEIIMFYFVDKNDLNWQQNKKIYENYIG